MEFDYYIYNAFDSTIAALLKVALIYANQNYAFLMTIAAVSGILFGAMVSVGKVAMQGKGNILSFIIPAIAGMLFFVALVQPKGTLYVYDSGSNQNQALDLPVIIVFLAGATNTVEKALIDIIDATSSYPTSNSEYAKDAGGLSFSMLEEAIKISVTRRSRYLSMSLAAFLDDCAAPALLQPNAPVIDSLDNQNIMQYLIDITNSYSANTTYYDINNRAGNTVSCETSINNINTVLSDATINDMISTKACEHEGFRVSTPAATQLCKDKLNSKLNYLGTDLTTFYKDVFLSDGIANAINNGTIQEAISAISNRNMQVGNYGAAQVANDWIPIIRSTMVAITFGLVPLVGLFIVTPLFFRVLLFVTGMFVWLATWSVVDALVHSFAIDMALKVFDSVANGTVGMSEIMTMPDTLTKAAGVFGKSRTIAVSISTVIMYSLFRFGGMALASAAGRFTENAQAAGERAGMQGGTTEGRGALTASIANGSGELASLHNQGWANYRGTSIANKAAQHAKIDAVSRIGGHDRATVNGALETGTGMGIGQGVSEARRVSAGEYSVNKFTPEQIANQGQAQEQKLTGGIEGDIAGANAVYKNDPDALHKASKDTSSTNMARNSAGAQAKLSLSGNNLKQFANLARQIETSNFSGAIGNSQAMHDLSNATNTPMTEIARTMSQFQNEKGLATALKHAETSNMMGQTTLASHESGIQFSTGGTASQIKDFLGKLADDGVPGAQKTLETFDAISKGNDPNTQYTLSGSGNFANMKVGRTQEATNSNTGRIQDTMEQTHGNKATYSKQDVIDALKTGGEKGIAKLADIYQKMADGGRGAIFDQITKEQIGYLQGFGSESKGSSTTLQASAGFGGDSSNDNGTKLTAKGLLKDGLGKVMPLVAGGGVLTAIGSVLGSIGSVRLSGSQNTSYTANTLATALMDGKSDQIDQLIALKDNKPEQEKVARQLAEQTIKETSAVMDAFKGKADSNYTSFGNTTGQNAIEGSNDVYNYSAADQSYHHAGEEGRGAFIAAQAMQRVGNSSPTLQAEAVKQDLLKDFKENGAPTYANGEEMSPEDQRTYASTLAEQYVAEPGETNKKSAEYQKNHKSAYDRISDLFSDD